MKQEFKPDSVELQNVAVYTIPDVTVLNESLFVLFCVSKLVVLKE